MTLVDLDGPPNVDEKKMKCLGMPRFPSLSFLESPPPSERQARSGTLRCVPSRWNATRSRICLMRSDRLRFRDTDLRCIYAPAWTVSIPGALPGRCTAIIGGTLSALHWRPDGPGTAARAMRNRRGRFIRRGSFGATPPIRGTSRDAVTAIAFTTPNRRRLPSLPKQYSASRVAVRRFRSRYRPYGERRVMRSRFAPGVTTESECPVQRGVAPLWRRISKARIVVRPYQPDFPGAAVFPDPDLRRLALGCFEPNPQRD
jgi:hypothetical protein